MSQFSKSREAFLNTEHAKVAGNIPDVTIIRDNAHRKSWELRQISTLNIEAIGSSSDSYEPKILGNWW